MQSNTLLIALLWNQLELMAENYNDERFGSSSEDTLLDVLLLFTEDETFLPSFREHHTGWILNLVAVIKSTQQEKSCLSLISIMFNIMKIADSSDASINKLQHYNSSGWTALIIILIEVCFVQFSEHKSIQRYFSVELQKLSAANYGVSSLIYRNLVDLALQENFDKDSTKPKQIRQHIISIFNYGHKHFSSWKISDEDCFAIINHLFIDVEKVYKNSNIDEDASVANLEDFVKDDIALHTSLENNYDNDYIGEILNFFYLSIIEAKSRKLFDLFDAKARLIFDIALCDDDVNETEINKKLSYHYSCISGLEDMLKSNGSHRSPSGKTNTSSAPWKEQQYLQSKHKEIDPLFHEIDSQQYEPSLRYRPFSLNTWDNILLDNNINVPLVLRKLYAQRLFGFAILHDCTLAEIHIWKNS